MEDKSGASTRGNSSSLAYIKVVAVKKLVVEPLSGASFGFGQASSRHPPTRLRGHSFVH